MSSVPIVLTQLLTLGQSVFIMIATAEKKETVENVETPANRRYTQSPVRTLAACRCHGRRVEESASRRVQELVHPCPATFHCRSSVPALQPSAPRLVPRRSRDEWVACLHGDSCAASLMFPKHTQRSRLGSSYTLRFSHYDRHVVRRFSLQHIRKRWIGSSILPQVLGQVPKYHLPSSPVQLSAANGAPP